MSGLGVRRVMVEIDLERFEADLSEGGYEGLGRVAAWKLVKEDTFDVQLSGARDYGLTVVSGAREIRTEKSEGVWSSTLLPLIGGIVLGILAQIIWS